MSLNINRFLKIPHDYSFFIFGARGTGKSTLIDQVFNLKNTVYLNLLLPAEEQRFSKNPEELIQIVRGALVTEKMIVIDEVQKVPKLLDVVHWLLEIEKVEKIFVLTGSSARKLKMAGVNLLAGRAFVYYLYPFSAFELGEKFNLDDALTWGLLPKVVSFAKPEQKVKFLQAYTLTYLKEEIWAEHLVKKLEPFRRFLEVSAQCNGKVLNYAKIARDVGADEKTIKSYFSLLEDTLLGVVLEPFEHSFRKRLKSAPKFYYFDLGVARALASSLSIRPQRGTSYYGEVFEQFIIGECIKLASYYQVEYRLSYFMSAAGAEIDLVVERAGKPKLFIEIKSSQNVGEEDLESFMQLVKDFKVADPQGCEAVCFSQDIRRKKIGEVMVYPWQEGLKYCFMPAESEFG